MSKVVYEYHYPHTSRFRAFGTNVEEAKDDLKEKMDLGDFRGRQFRIMSVREVSEPLRSLVQESYQKEPDLEGGELAQKFVLQPWLNPDGSIRLINLPEGSEKAFFGIMSMAYAAADITGAGYDAYLNKIIGREHRESGASRRKVNLHTKYLL